MKPEEDMSMLRYHHEQKQIEIPFFLHEDAESLLEEIEPWIDSPGKSYTVDINKHTSGPFQNILMVIQNITWFI